jgi:thioredoxin reductase (NADPH)
MHDLIIIGGGPAGLSAAITARARNKDVLVVSNPAEHNPLAASSQVDNYPGMPGATGLHILETMHRQAHDLGAQFLQARVISVLPMPAAQGTGNTGSFAVTTSSDYVEGASIIIACGAASGGKPYPGEQNYLGRGVSYCATCDGMLYRTKTVFVVGLSKEAPEEANFLAELGATVHYVARELPAPARLDHRVQRYAGRLVAIEGNEQGVTSAQIARRLPEDSPKDDQRELTLQVQGVFILRPGIAPTNMLASLDTQGGFIKTDTTLATNIPGVFAAGDCTGKPLQVAKAVGQGQLAAFSAVEYLAAVHKGTAEDASNA